MIIENNESSTEQWINTENSLNESWGRVSGGQFVLKSLGDQVIPSDSVSSLKTLALLAVKCCLTPAEVCGQHVLPSYFHYCPDCGANLETLTSLIRSSPSSQTHWLSPTKSVSSVCGGELSGFKCTPQEIVLADSFDRDFDSDAKLPFPVGAEYCFTVGTFGFQDIRLLAIDIKTHTMFILNPDGNRWQQIIDRDGMLMETALPSNVWGMAVLDPRESDRLYLPCRNGLVEVRVNLFTLDFSSRLLVAGQIKSALVIRGETLYVPVETSDGLQLYRHDLLTPDGAGELLPCTGSGNDLFYPVVVQDGRKILWSGKTDQLIVHFSGDQIESYIVSWEADLEPEFEFGPPILFQNLYWQLCFDNRQVTYCYVRMGARVSAGERRVVPNPRFSTGLTHFLDYENFHRGEPWFVDENNNDRGQILIPLLEFGANSQEMQLGTPSVLCIRLDSSESLHDILNDTARQRCELLLLGEPEQVLGRFHIRQPWTMQCFLYNGFLWVYHRELKQISGWRLAG